LPIDPRDEPRPAEPSLDAGRTVEAVIPQTLSVDDFGIESPHGRDPGDATLADAGVVTTGSSANGRSHAAWSSREEPATRVGFPMIELDSQRPAPGSGPPGGEPAWEPTRREPSRLVVWLGSYASAMTLACAWLWWHGRRAEPVAHESPTSEALAVAGVGQRESHSAKVAPAPPIPADRITALGRPLRVGSLEFTPVAVRVGRVELEHKGLDGSYEMRDGGEGALLLQVRLRNLSDDESFAPLDEAFVREPDRGLPESFLESPGGERIYMYRLPQASEWSIVGQAFDALRPGETRETLLVSDEAAWSRMVGAMVWRLRLRSGADPGRSELVGVRVEPGQVQ
jgi:hypothetical protein